MASTQPVNPGQIVVKRGQFSTDTCTTENNLIANAAIKPQIRNLLEYKNKRYLMTLLTSGAFDKGGNNYFVNNNQKTKIPMVKTDGGGIGGNAYYFDSIGRIEKAATIRSQVGASGVDGSFTLNMLDEYLYPGWVVRFSSGYLARVQNYPTGSSASGWNYNFKSVNGTQFVFATHVGVTKTCFPMFSAYSEGSLNSDSRDKHPDRLVNHMTIQRKTGAMTGSAKSDILWYSYENGAGIGWMPWKIDQMNAVFTEENERHKWFSVSSMKNSDGSLATVSNMGNDPTTGLPIIIGDGWQEQVLSSNIMVASGTDGNATEDNFTDMMQLMQLGSNQVKGITWVMVTGTSGYANFQRKAVNLAGNQNIQLMQSITQSAAAGGAVVDMGYDFASINFAGNKITCIIHPMFDDPKIFPEIGQDGKPLMSGTYFLMGVNSEDTPTMEILAKNANGVNRSYVQASFTGMTGSAGMVQSEVDADKWAVLKEDLFCIYNPALCGIIYKAS
jgi:hypothetical protein